MSGYAIQLIDDFDSEISGTILNKVSGKYIPGGTTIVMKENTPQITMEMEPIHRRPHLSRNRVSKMAAGSSVKAARENEVNTSGSNNFMFHTWPSNARMIRSLRTDVHMIRAVLTFGVWTIFYSHPQINCR